MSVSAALPWILLTVSLAFVGWQRWRQRSMTEAPVAKQRAAQAAASEANDARRKAEENNRLLVQLASSLPGIAWIVNLEWIILVSRGRGLGRFSLGPGQVEGEDVRGYIDLGEMEAYRQVMAAERVTLAYVKEITAETHPDSPEAHGSFWQISLEVAYNVDGEPVGVLAYADQIGQEALDVIRRDLKAELQRARAAALDAHDSVLGLSEVLAVRAKAAAGIKEDYGATS